MRAIQLASFGIIPAALFIAACGDDVTKVTEIEKKTSGLEVVASADSLGKCTAEISGEMKFATKENAVYVCADSAWKNVSEAEKASCSAEALSDGSGFKIVCDGDSIGVVKNGEDGKEGVKGDTGEGCEVSDGGDGTVSVTCGESSATLYKALCGNKPYEPDSNFCFNDSIVSLCGGESYDLGESFCVENLIAPQTKKLVWNLMNPEIEYGVFVDDRDDQVYRSVKIGEQIWMAENLNYAVDSSYCYEDSLENCQKYGRLYATRDIAKSACPAGWHLPDNSEFESLIASADGRDLAISENMVGKALKSKSGWRNMDDGKDGNGTDSLGFSALPAGYKGSNPSFTYIGERAYFWSSSGEESVDRYLLIFSDGDDGGLWQRTVAPTAYSHSYSVRCVKD